jgi:hypothetical protein
MSVETKTKNIKSKEQMPADKIKKFLKKSNFFKITIYFETTIQESPLNKDYFTSNDY